MKATNESPSKGECIVETIIGLFSLAALTYAVIQTNIKSTLSIDYNKDGKTDTIFLAQDDALYGLSGLRLEKLVSDNTRWNDLYYFGDMCDNPKIVGIRDDKLINLSDRVDELLFTYFTSANPTSEVIARWDGNLNGDSGSLVLVKGADSLVTPQQPPYTSLIWVQCDSSGGYYWAYDDGGVKFLSDIIDYPDNHTVSPDGSFSLTTPEGLSIKYDAQTQKLTVNSE
jgi:hypothetical protein